MAYGPIVRNIREDPMKEKKPLQVFYLTYEGYLYKEIKKGSFPKYKLLCNNKIKLLEKIDQMEQAYDLKSVGDVSSHMVPELNPLYDSVVMINTETGEIVEE